MTLKQSFIATLMATTMMTCVAPAIAQDENESSEAEDARELGVVTVTAARREQSVQDVPYNISAVSGAQLENLGLNSVSDLAGFVPGLNFVDLGARGNLVSSGLNIRGINAEDISNFTQPLASVPPVSTYVDETPVFANLRLVDINRVEVLRGPQGTLYGSGSLGGTVRFIQNQPELGVSESTLIGAVGFTEEADAPDYSLDAIFNLPIGDKVALRANVGYERSAGFIDYTNLNQLDAERAPVPVDPSSLVTSPAATFRSNDLNEDTVWNARVALLWEPNDKLSAQVSYQHQTNESESFSAVTPSFPGAGEFDNASFAASPFESDVDLVSLDWTYDLGFASLASSSSYSRVEGNGTGDVTGTYLNFEFFEPTYGAHPRPLILEDTGLDDSSFVQEVRLTSNGANVIDWTIGAYYRSQEYDGELSDFFPGYQTFFEACGAANGIDPFDPLFPGLNDDTTICGTGGPFGIFTEADGIPLVRDLVYISDFQQEFQDTALFGEATWNISDRWQVTGGFRAFWQDFDVQQQNGAVFTARIDPAVLRDVGSSTEINDTIFKANTSFDLNDDHKVYATWSEGFRRGGVNALPAAIFDVFAFEFIDVAPALQSYEPDTVTNFEVGLKGNLGDLRYTIAAFQIDWEDIQLNSLVTPNALVAVINAGDAESKGFEAEIAGELHDNLSVTASYTYVDASLTSLSQLAIDEVFFGAAPNPSSISLPGTPEHSLSWSAIYYKPMGNGELFADLTGTYNSATQVSIDPGANRELEGFSIIGIGAGYGTDDWDIRASIDNLLNEDGVVAADDIRANSVLGQHLTNDFIIRPRSFMLSLTKRF